MNRERLKHTGLILFLLLIVMAVSQACYTDNEEELYVNLGNSNCDTSNVTYAQTLAPMMANYCNGCHNGSSAGGGWRTDNYASLKTLANNGKLNGVVNWLSGYSPMPKNGSKLNDCNLKKIKKWLSTGAPNN